VSYLVIRSVMMKIHLKAQLEFCPDSIAGLCSAPKVYPWAHIHVIDDPSANYQIMKLRITSILIAQPQRCLGSSLRPRQ
jgi:hypothetical protein